MIAIVSLILSVLAVAIVIFRSSPPPTKNSDAVQLYEVELMNLEVMEIEQQQKRDKVIALIEKKHEGIQCPK